MKVDPADRKDAAESASKPKFDEALKKVTGGAAAAKPKHGGAKAPTNARTAARSKPAASEHSAITQPMALAEVRAASHRSAEALKHARSQMNAEAGRLADVRSESARTQEEKVHGRVLDLIVDELAVEFGVSKLPKGPDQATTQPMSGAEIAKAAAASAKEPAAQKVPRVEDIAALVDQIRLLVKNNRPAMAMSVGGSLNAHVEIERTGSKQISLRVIGKGALPRAGDLNKIRDSLAAKGIKVTVLEVAVR